MSRQTWVQDPKTGKLIPKEEYQREGSNSPYIQGDIESFVSPIDGSVISDRGQLRRHMSEHGVTNSHDYSPAFLAKRAAVREAEASGATPAARADRIELIRRAMDE